MARSYQFAKAVDLYQAGETVKGSAKQSGLPLSSLYSHLKFRNLLRQERKYKHRPDPTPEEIAERCAEIQKGWSPAEMERRHVARGASSHLFDRLARRCHRLREVA